MQRVLAGALARRIVGVGALLVLGGLALIGILVLRLLAQILGQAEMRQHLAHPDREVLLAAELLAERRPVLAGPAVEDAPPGVQDLALLARQAEAEQMLAGVELERLAEAGLGLIGRGATGRRPRAACALARLAATPAIRLAPSASTRTCSSASNTAPARSPCGFSRLCSLTS